jgi:hypothetical protein
MPRLSAKPLVKNHRHLQGEYKYCRKRKEFIMENKMFKEIVISLGYSRLSHPVVRIAYSNF